MDDRERRTSARSENVEGRPETAGAAGTPAGRARTTGTESELEPQAAHRDRSESDEEHEETSSEETSSEERERARARRRPELDPDEGAGATRRQDRVDGGEEGIAGEGEDESGTLPGSTGGVTGTAGHPGGSQSPGSTEAGFPGISPEEARRLRRRGRRKER